MKTLEELESHLKAAEADALGAAMELADEMLVEISIPAVRWILRDDVVEAIHEYRIQAQAWEKATQAFLDHAQTTELNERTRT